MVHATNIYAYPNVHISSSCLPYIHLKTTMCPDIIFQFLLHCSRPMTSHYVTDHVTLILHASSLFKIKENKNKNKRSIKSQVQVSLH